jgi:chemotaxis protein methyltransferase CheR
VTGDIATAEVERFRKLVTELLGLSLERTDTHVLASALNNRSAQQQLTPPQYLRQLAAGPARKELAALAEALTITETYFFRHTEQLHALAEVALPARIRARTSEQRLRLLSLGCASGEEAYTLAILALTAVPVPPWDVSILGVDANPAALRKATEARYSEWSLREVTAGTENRWFQQHGREAQVDARVRRVVRFTQHNLAEDNHSIWRSDEYDVVFCRNVLMYLTRQAARAVIARTTRSLAPGGFLFLGHTDTLGGEPAGLHVRHSHNAFYYQRAAAVAAPAPATTPAARTFAEPEPADPAPETSIPYRLATRLLAEERFTEALAVIEALPGYGPTDRDIALLHAVLLAQSGQPDRAMAACRRRLNVEGLDADVHCLLAMCHESDDELIRAAEHHTFAAYLDPDFAMPHLRLGQLARRRGDDRTADAEFDRALELLRYERDDRILYFGGGFGRHALLALCRAELHGVKELR